MSLNVVRDAAGKVTAGAANLNPTGVNQFNSPRLRNVARVDLAVDKRMQEDPFCAQGVADQIIEALGDLKADKALEIVRLFLSKGPLEEIMGSAALISPEPEPVDHSTDAFDELASDFGSNFPIGAELAENAE